MADFPASETESGFGAVGIRELRASVTGERTPSNTSEIVNAGEGMGELVPRKSVLPEFMTPTGLYLPQGVTYEQWEALGNMLGHIERTTSFWIGDWVNYGETEYGEKYSQALDATGLAYQTLMNYASVCRNIETYRRRENLSFGHHAEVAKLEPAQQDLWLDVAETGEWSRARLRREPR